MADRDEGVLQARAGAVVVVDVAGRDGGDSQPLRQAGEPAVAGAVVALEGALKLHPQVLGPEGGEQGAAERRRPGQVPSRPGRGQGALAGAAGEADEPLGVLGERRRPRPRLPGGAAGALAGAGVGLGQQPAEVAVAGRGLDQQRQVGEVGALFPPGLGAPVPSRLGEVDRQLGAGYRPHAQPLAGVGELHRPPDPVVVGQRQRRVAEVGRGAGQLGRGRGAVEEGEGRVGVQLYIWGVHRAAAPIRPAGGTSARSAGRGRRWR